MYQKDYILRMAEMVAKLIAGIMGKIINKDFSSATEELNNIYFDILNEDASYFSNIPENELTNKLLEKHNYTHDHLAILAELFNAEAELRLAQGDMSGSLEYSRKSIILFEFLDTEQNIYSQERIDKMEAIRNRIESLH